MKKLLALSLILVSFSITARADVFNCKNLFSKDDLIEQFKQVPINREEGVDLLKEFFGYKDGVTIDFLFKLNGDGVVQFMDHGKAKESFREPGLEEFLLTLEPDRHVIGEVHVDLGSLYYINSMSNINATFHSPSDALLLKRSIFENTSDSDTFFHYLHDEVLITGNKDTLNIEVKVMSGTHPEDIGYRKNFTFSKNNRGAITKLVIELFDNPNNESYVQHREVYRVKDLIVYK